MTKVYTKKGDKGLTSLHGGEIVSKSDLRIESYGAIDELIANIGLLKAFIKNQNIWDFLHKIQKDLMNIAAILVNQMKEKAFEDFQNNWKETTILEKEIDKIDKQLDTLNTFIIPGDNKPSSICHVVRTVCRRTERIIIQLSEKETINVNIIQYLNRLSDYFFVLSRLLSINYKNNKNNNKYYDY